MIPRRVYEHVKAHNWFAVAVDFVIVVVGVFVGLQVSNWNAARVEKRAANIYIERVREDLRDNEQDLLRRIDYYAGVRSHALAALAAFDAPQDAAGEQFLIDAFQASQILTRSIDRSTYDEILSVGALNSIPSVLVRRRLAIYYQNADAIDNLVRLVPPYRETLRRLMPYPVQAAMFEKCDDVAPTDEGGGRSWSLPEACDLGLPGKVVADAAAALRNDELRLDLQRLLSDLETKQINYRRLIERSRALEAFLLEEAP